MSSSVFIILLRFGDHRAKAGQLMDGHNAWIQRGFDDKVFVLVGSLPPDLGGGIVAHNTSRTELEERVSGDPLVAAGVVSAEILDLKPAKADARLEFLLPVRPR